MNYLAHIFLSGQSKQMQFGNFIGDAVKGSSYKNYPPVIANGILLHRAIDTFTDSHPAVRKAVYALKPYFGRYSAVILDMYFDYLLASRFDQFSDISLKCYTRNFYFTIIRNFNHLPTRFKHFMWHFIGTNRLSKYATPNGIRHSLEIMVSVHNLDFPVDTAISYLCEHEDELWDIFKPFFDELQAFCSEIICQHPIRIML